MRIEIGKTYLDRRGNEVMIVKKDDYHLLPFVGDDGCGYTEDGRFVPADQDGWEQMESNFDLVSEKES